MKQQSSSTALTTRRSASVILGSVVAIAIATGYFGCRAFGSRTMYVLGAGMIGLGAIALVKDMTSNGKQSRTK